MYKNRLICEDTYYVGGSDRRIALFENIYPLNDGVSYNSYLILDEKTCLLDTVDLEICDLFLEKVEDVLNGRDLDYLVIHHMEPDHSASLLKLLDKYKNVTLVVNEKIKVMLLNFFNLNYDKMIVVKEGDSLSLGKHTLSFVFAPMVHWPEVMVSYDSYTGTLFSADAFGTFGALSGNIFADEVDYENQYLDEARRYYTNIVGKYGLQVQNALKKASTLDIKVIASLHGPIWRKNLGYLLGKYDKWSKYEPETNGVLIIYGSIYGHTAKVSDMLANELSLLNIPNVKMYDASKTDKSILLSECFKYSHIVIASATYNMGIFTPIEELLIDLKAHNFQNRKIALIENGSWAPSSLNLMKKIVLEMKNMKIIEPNLTIKSNIKEEQVEVLNALANEIKKDFFTKIVENKALFNINYGLFVLTTLKEDGSFNGCVINTISQISNNPDRLLVSVNKANYSASLLEKNGECNISVLTKDVPFEVIKRFGMASGKENNKFDGFNSYDIATNNIPYLTKFSNSYLSLKVEKIVDFGSHFGFICEISDSKVLNDEESVTYDYYLKNIKVLPPKTEAKKKGWVCKVCGYIYEGEELPDDFVCPLCKHGKEDFEKIGD